MESNRFLLENRFKMSKQYSGKILSQSKLHGALSFQIILLFWYCLWATPRKLDENSHPTRGLQLRSLRQVLLLDGIENGRSIKRKVTLMSLIYRIFSVVLC